MSFEFNEPPERPDEKWWERELFQNQKLMDKYMAVLGDHPDWEKWQFADDLHDRVRSGTEPAETPENDPFEFETDHSLDGEVPLELESNSAETGEASADADEEMEAFENNPAENEGYPEISQQARDFAVRVMKLEDPTLETVFYLSAGRICANLAGGHGLGYDEETICGNIVKCRWALSDCEFCREMLEHLFHRTNHTEYAALLQDCRALSSAIKERIERLRARVWW
ncbi:MAG: hypothetical protein AB1813_03890 [Verrucomicrobiota bacterium]|jgi:hypothetical protein